jgi:DNA-binding GntR family transcriptional regulator
VIPLHPGRAAQRRSAGRANRRFAAALRRNDVDEAIAADDAFHGVAVTVAANEAISAVLDQVSPVLRRAERARFASLSGRRSVVLHDEIIRLAAAGEPDEAGRAARDNWLTLQLLVDPDEHPCPPERN